MSNNTSNETERNALVGIMALLDEVDRRFNAMGSQQMMSVGPVLEDVRNLREELVDRGKGYGILPEKATVEDLRHDAHDLEVIVGSTMKRFVIRFSDSYELDTIDCASTLSDSGILYIYGDDEHNDLIRAVNTDSVRDIVPKERS